MKISYLLFTLFFVLAVCSCSEPFQEKSFNTAASFTRNNSYENYEDFQANVMDLKIYSKSDSSSEEGGANPIGSHFEPLVVGETDYYLCGSDASFSFIANNQLKFKIATPDNSLIASKPAADINQNFYFITLAGNIYAYSNKGKMLWTKKFVDSSNALISFSDVLALDDGIVLGNTDGQLRKYDLSGNIIFDKQFGAAISKSFAADKSKNIIFAISFNQFGGTDSLAMLDSIGNVKFTRAIDFVRIIKNPVVSEDNIYIAGLFQTGNIQGSLIACYNRKGNEKWRQEIPVFPRFISANQKGDLLVTGYNTGVGEAMSGLFAYNKNGKQLWRLYISATVSAPLIIGDTKIAVLGNTPKGAALFFLQKETGKMILDKAMNELPTFYSTPAVLGNGSLVFALNQQLGIIRVTDTAVNQTLPW